MRQERQTWLDLTIFHRSFTDFSLKTGHVNKKWRSPQDCLAFYCRLGFRRFFLFLFFQLQFSDLISQDLTTELQYLTNLLKFLTVEKGRIDNECLIHSVCFVIGILLTISLINVGFDK